MRSGKITKTGKAAYLAAVDPFHDVEIENLEGWPDMEVAPSVVRKIPSSFTVKAIEEGGSILIMTYPLLNNQKMCLMQRRNAVIDTIFDGVSTNTSMALCVVYNYSAAQSAGSLPLTGATSPVVATFAVPTIDLSDGPCRLIGQGVEVHDVTADIYKQGTVTVGQVPQATGEIETLVARAQTIGSTTYVQTPITGVPIARPPTSLVQMMQYPTSKQWAAREGAYVVVPFTGEQNDPTLTEYRAPILGSSTVPDPPGSLNTLSQSIGSFAGGSVNGDNLVFLGNIFAPVHSKFIYLSGLNASSTFTINHRAIVESFPVSTSPIVTLASPSAKYDPVSLRLISAAMNRMPVGVPVGDNPDGEWFWETLQSALPYIGGLGSLIFPEFSPLIAAGTTAGVAALKARKKPKPARVIETKTIKTIPAHTPAGQKAPAPPPRGSSKTTR